MAVRTDREKMRIRQREKEVVHGNCLALWKLVQVARKTHLEAKKKVEIAKLEAEKRDAERCQSQGYPSQLEANRQRAVAAQ